MRTGRANGTAKVMTHTPPLGSGPTSRKGSADTANAGAAPPSRPKRVLVMGAVLVIVAGGAYGVGRLQGALALNRAEERYGGNRQVWQTTQTACEVDRSLLTARRSLSLVALELDRRNFGVAETHRRAAAQALTQPSLSGVADVSKLAENVQAMDLGVDPNPGAKREQVIALSEALDRVSAAGVGKAPAPTGSAAKP